MQNYLKALAIAALLSGLQSAEAQTWIQWSAAAGGNNHYYALTLSATNWAAAQEQAVAWGGTLATITSSNEQNFINTTFLTGKFEHQPLWIGLVDSDKLHRLSAALRWTLGHFGFTSKGTFVWVTGEPLAYTNWKEGEPSNSSPGENYVAINWEYSDTPPRGNKGDWNDTPLDGTRGYGPGTDGPYFGIVERETPPGQPAPASTFSMAVWLGAVAIFSAVVVWWIRSRRRKVPEA